MSDSNWCDIHESWVNDGATCYICGCVEAERERIIALLDENLEKVMGCGCCLELEPDELIALIKGENK